MRILIVDDERPARDKLRRLLALETDVSAIDEAADGVAALECLPVFKPDLLLLDIQMPEINGLELAASLPSPAPLVVFVTAYDDYAIRALDANAIDYQLKPYDQARLQRALQRARQRLAVQPPAYPLQPLVVPIVMAHWLQPVGLAPALEGALLVILTVAISFAVLALVRRVAVLRPLFGLGRATAQVPTFR